MSVLKKAAVKLMAVVTLPLLICGCGHPFGVPGNARLCSQGAHPGCTARAAGRVWVYDQTANRMVYDGAVSSEQDLSVDPVGNQITVDGKPAVANALEPRHKYQIYFAPAAGK